MRIALNARILQAPRTGIGQYLVELVAALRAQPELDLELFHGWSWSRQLPEAALPGYGRWTALARRLPGAYGIRRRLEQRHFSRGIEKAPVDLYHEPSLWPLDFDGPTVMTVHDLTHLHYPETQPRERLAEIERRIGPAMERARLILTDSQFVADEITAHYGVAPERLVVAPLGHAPRFHPRPPEALAPRLSAFGLRPGRYLLCVGTLEPRKNLTLALRAYRRLPAGLRRRFPLLIVGMPGWKQRTLAGELRDALADGSVRLLGYQPDDVLAELLAGARLLLFPSLYEGFGLPVLEALASGVPVLLSPRSALPEVAGEAGIYLEADDEPGWSEAIVRLIEDGQAWLRQRTLGLEQASRFSWQRCARITAAAYRRALEG
ncbi:glycosyltransferase family 4 protein [Zestomonas thermotolerans]|uniref:glycosyltransferase family 4 protein n=1 Tax=Zestomonas thermotolerans TaxID=157784 RepID=UPI0004852AB1|nr:glycosyltransferase family 1 protein [Pseudomonas thermotolerans]